MGEDQALELEPRTLTMLVCGVLAVVLFAGMSLLPVPFAAMRPGPVRDVLGQSGGTPLISIEGHETYETAGALNLLTVSVEGGPGRQIDLGDLVFGWFDSAVSVRSERELFPVEQTEEELERESTMEMVSSQENATAAALAELDIAVPTTLTLVGFTDGSHADTRLQEADVVTAVEGQPVHDLPQLREVLQRAEPGSAVDVTVVRDGEEVTVPVRTQEAPGDRTVLGVLIDPEYEFPFDVTIQIENVGGPSAGMMFSLGIIDKLTPGAMTGGERIAGTGTIDSAGGVGPIGGIQQKLVAADRADASWFLAPESNCDEVVGHVPDGLQVVSVSTLAQARTAVEAIGAGEGTDALPACS